LLGRKLATAGLAPSRFLDVRHCVLLVNYVLN